MEQKVATTGQNSPSTVNGINPSICGLPLQTVSILCYVQLSSSYDRIDFHHSVITFKLPIIIAVTFHTLTHGQLAVAGKPAEGRLVSYLW